ncbi:MAG: HAMP domain-containing histidine kinase [Lachnospiraceae bacterium]|nr:HAMP domain-containing histidine kinase [Lachnospiraceae bacterium]
MQKDGKIYKINKQVAWIFIGVILLVIGYIAAMNSFLLGFYYCQEKTHVMQDAYEKINEWYSSSDDESTAFELSMEKIHVNNNLAIIILEPDGDTVYTTGKEDSYYHDIMIDAILGDHNGGKSRIWLKMENYSIVEMEDERLDESYIVLWGTLDDGNLILIRSPLESMKESARISNRFFLMGSVVAIIVSAYVSILLTKKITKPILQLTELSERMTEMDFDVKYESSHPDRRNEIDILGEHMNELSDTLEKNIIDLKKANHKLQRDIVVTEENQQKQKEFIRNVSHELKTPIAVISGYAEGLKDSINDDPDSREFYCDVIIDEANRMNKMVLELINLNQLEMGLNQLDIQRINICDLISNFLPSYKILFEQNDIEFELNMEDNIDVYADEYAIEQVFNNYLSNAIHYCKGENKKIVLNIIKSGNICRISVFNTGDKIPDEALPHIWDTFYKVDKARTRAYGGTGVGLSIVKAVMDDLNQQYGVINRENGVEFWFELEC